MSSSAMEDAYKNPWATKYGLPNWMKYNVERLNTSTDFEQYACSPPETDSGFLCEFDKKHPELKTSRSAPQLADQDNFHVEGSHRVRRFGPPTAQFSAPHLVLPKEPVGSSAETTPNTTPQSSPYLIRKMRQITEEDMNSKKWFYGGNFEHKPFPVGEDSQLDGKPRKPVAGKQLTSPSSSNKKYNVSNFDLNAVSPTSW